MSRNNKSARNGAIAKSFSEARQKGQKGPKRTEAKHGKTKAWWQLGSYAQFILGKRKTRAEA